MDFLPTRTRICLDFDGVLSEYHGNYRGPHIHGKPLPGVKRFLQKLKDADIEIVVLTTKDSHPSIRKWFKKYDLLLPDGITSHKVPASAYVDDRAVYFDGNFNHLTKKLGRFHVHWRNKRPFKMLGKK
jgi:ribonucleotide monophosphatase NagD (HAD superfamily)